MVKSFLESGNKAVEHPISSTHLNTISKADYPWTFAAGVKPQLGERQKTQSTQQKKPLPSLPSCPVLRVDDTRLKQNWEYQAEHRAQGLSGLVP